MGSVTTPVFDTELNRTSPRRSPAVAIRDTRDVLASRYGTLRIDHIVALGLVLLFFLPARLVYVPLGAEGRPATILGLLLFLWWCLTKLVPRLAPRGRQPLRIALWAFIAALLLAWLAGLDRGPLPVEIRAMDRTMLARISFIGFALVIADAVRTRRSLDRLLLCLVYCGGFMGLVAFLQFVLKYDPVPLLRFPPLQLNADLIGYTERGAAVRVASTALHAIELGVVAAMILPIAIHFALRAGTNNERIFRWMVAALLGAAIPFSGSRSGYVGFAVVIVTMMWGWSTSLRVRAVAVTVLGLGVFKLMVPGLLGTIRYLFLNLAADDSVAGRTEDYNVIFDYIGARPILGRGPGSFIPDEYIVLDNELLYSAVTIGLVGLVATAVLVVVALVQSGWVAHHGGTNETRHLGQALKASILVGVFASFTFDSLSFATFGALWFILFGCAAALWRIERDGRDLEIDPDAQGDFTSMLVTSRLTDPSQGEPTLVQISTTMVRERAER